MKRALDLGCLIAKERICDCLQYLKPLYYIPRGSLETSSGGYSAGQSNEQLTHLCLAVVCTWLCQHTVFKGGEENGKWGRVNTEGPGI